MKAVTVKELKNELNNRPPKEVLDLCLRLSRFKKENKELLTYLLFEASDEWAYIESVKQEIDLLFSQVTIKSNYLLRKSIRAILKITKKYVRYSLKKETEVELLIHFCVNMKAIVPAFNGNKRLQNLYNNQLYLIKKVMATLHEDLQYDYKQILKEL